MIEQLSNKKIEVSIGLGIAIISFIVYLSTLCPTVDYIDSGELAAVAYYLGIGHPTGYPLFTVLGYIFAHAPLPFSVIMKLNIMAAIFCAVGLFFFFRFLVNIINYYYQDKSGKSDANLFLVLSSAAFGTFILAFSQTYWLQALSVEVYSLHSLFISLLLFVFVKAVSFTDKSLIESTPKYGCKYWILFSYLLGLSFTNHLTTVVMIPAFLIVSLQNFGISNYLWNRAKVFVVSFVVGLSLYFYLPFRAAEQPLFNWGNPIDFEKFFWHVSGKVYRVWFLSSIESALKQSQYFFNTLPEKFVYIPILFCIIGLLLLIRKKWIFIFTLVLFLGCFFYAINYDIHDIDSYFLVAYYSFAIWCAFGISWLLNFFKTRIIRKFIFVCFICLMLVILYVNYFKVDKSEHYTVEEYTKDLLSCVEHNGIVISYQWDYFISASYYFQWVEKYRPDVVVIDKELLRRSWYFKQLEKKYPWLIKLVQKEINVFLQDLYKFEHDLPYNSAVIENNYREVIKSIIRTNIDTRPVYITPEIEPEYIIGFNKVPSGLVFKLTKDEKFIDIKKPNYLFIPRQRDDKYYKGIYSLYIHGYRARVDYLLKNGLYEYALKEIENEINSVQKIPELKILRDELIKLLTFNKKLLY